NAQTHEELPLGDIRINRVSVGGEFNRWSTDVWPMARSGDTWVTTRPITEFEASRELKFKFVINGRYWAEPPADAQNRALAPGNAANLVLKTDRPEPVRSGETNAQRTVHR